MRAQLLRAAGLAFLRQPTKAFTILLWLATGRRVRARTRLMHMVGPEVPLPRPNYAALWLRRHAVPDRAALDAAMTAAAAWRDPPPITLLMPFSATDLPDMAGAIDSVRRQAYGNWRLLLLPDAGGPTAPTTSDPRIAVVAAGAGGDGAGPTVKDLAGDGLFGILDPADRLPAHALLRMAGRIRDDGRCDVVYSDEALIDSRGKAAEIAFRPDWNEELFLSSGYVGNLALFRATLVPSALPSGGPALPAEGRQALVTRLIAGARPGTIVHIPEVLCHRRIAGTSSPAAMGLSLPGPAAVDYLARKGQAVRIAPGRWGRPRIVRPVPSPEPLVSVVIPTRDRADLLASCIDGILTGTDYRNVEVIVVDNESREPATLALLRVIAADPRVHVIGAPGPFNYSALNNLAVEDARGSILALVNNDIAVIDPGWLRELVSYAVLPGIGAVGPLLLYPNGRLQHAGIVLGGSVVARHGSRNIDPAERGFLWRHQFAQYVTAVTGACLVLRREAYLAAGGLNETDLRVGFNDVDLCLRLRRMGLENVYTPHAVLTHAEFASRGLDNLDPDKRRRWNAELQYMRDTWGEAARVDPNYNPNLTPIFDDFSIDI